MDFEVITLPNASISIGPYALATRSGDFIFVSGQGPFDPKTGKVVEGGIRAQTRQVLENITSILEAADTDLAHVVKVMIFLTDWKYFQEMNETYATFFPGKQPARSTVQGARWPEGALLAMEATALVR